MVGAWSAVTSAATPLAPSDRPDVSVVVPTRQGADRLEGLWAAVRPVVGRWDGAVEVIFVDDGSTDATWACIDALAVDPRVRGVRLARQVGQAGALCAGFSVARGEVVVSMDDDLEIAPEGIGLLADAIRAGAGFASGRRTTRGGPPVRRFASQLYNARLRLAGFPLHDAGCGFNATDAEVGRRFSELGWEARLHRCKPMTVILTDRIVEVPLPAGRPSGRSNFSVEGLAMSWLDVEFWLGVVTPARFVVGGIVAPVVGAVLLGRPGRRSPRRGLARLAASVGMVGVAVEAGRLLARQRSLEARTRSEPAFEIIDRIGV